MESVRHRRVGPYSLAFFILATCLFVAVQAWCQGGFQTELVQFKTTDGVTLTGALRRPSSGSSAGCLVMVHGYGGNFYSGVMSALPQLLASQGLTTLAVNLRDHDKGPKQNLFEESRYDIDAAIDYMASCNCDPLILHGHSMGSNSVLYALAEADRPNIRGAVLTSPPGNLYEWNVRMAGEKVAAAVLGEAEHQIATGKGNELMLINLGPLGKALYTANYLVSLRGPATRSDPFKNIARVALPILIVQGTADQLVDSQVAERLKQASLQPDRVQVGRVEGAGHDFRAQEGQLAKEILNWLSESKKPVQTQPRP